MGFTMFYHRDLPCGAALLNHLPSSPCDLRPLSWAPGRWNSEGQVAETGRDPARSWLEFHRSGIKSFIYLINMVYL